MDVTTKDKIKALRKLFELNRINILKLLFENETCVCQMVVKLKIKHNLLSHHLKTLIDLGYIENNRNGQHIMYHIVESKRHSITELLDLITT